MSADLQVALLGPVQAERAGAAIALGGTKQRIVLSLLALEVGRVVSADRLIDALWGDNPPEKALGTLQVYVSNLRRLLADPSAGTTVLLGRRPGYLLDVPTDRVDVRRFEALAANGRLNHRGGDLAAASAALHQALALWRGRPLADLADEPFAAGEIARLDEARVAVVEERVEIELAMGRHREVIADLEALVAEYPLREQLWGALMLALYRAGRQADALQTYALTRTTLADQLGLNPGPELRRLEQSILRHDPGLDIGTRLRTNSACVTLSVDVSDTVPRAWLVFPRGGRVPLGRGRLVIGRSDDCDIVVPDPRASRRHAAVRGGADGFDVIDLDSRNGTAIGELSLAPMTSHRLSNGEEVVVGTTRLMFTTVPATTPAA